MELRDKTFEEEVLKSPTPVLVDFWGSWCIPCKTMEPIIEKIRKKYDGNLKFTSLNVNRNPRTPAKYKIAGVPTYAIFWKGEIVKRDVGAKSEKQLSDFIESGLEEIEKL